MTRRPLILEHQEKYGLVPSVRRQKQRLDRLERAERTGDTTVTRVTVQGGGVAGPPGPPGTPGTGTSLYSERATQVLAAATTIAVTDGTPLTPFTTTGPVVSTAVPLIAAARDGQFVVIRNDNVAAANTFTIRDDNVVPTGSKVRLTADTIAIAPGGVLALVYSTILAAWVQQYYIAPKQYPGSIATFTVDALTALTHEWGDGSTANDTAPAFALTYVGIPSACAILLDLAAYLTLTTPFLSGTGAAYCRSATRDAIRTFRASATVNGVPCTQDVIVTYRAPNYYGIGTQTTGLTSAQVVALSRVLATTQYGSFAVNATAGNYIWLAFADAPAPYFAIAGERAQFDLKDNPVSVTGTYLKVANYYTYRSLLAALGAVTVVTQAARPPTKRYVGKVGQATQLSEAQIEALQLSDLVESPNGTFASILSLGAGDYLWFCVSDANIAAPAHYGISPAAGASGYQEAAFTAMAVQAVTNAYGYTENYKNIHSNVTGFQAIRINNATYTTWSLATRLIAYPNRLYMGPAPVTDPITNANILALDDAATGVSVLASAVAGSYAVTITGGNYLWFCHPASMSDLATIKDHSTGFGVAGSYRTNVSHTNDFGFTETYRCWRSDNPGIFPSGGQIDVT